MPQDLSALVAQLREAVEQLHGCGIPSSSLYASAAAALEAQAAEIARQQQVITDVNARCDHLGMRLGEVIKERDGLRVDAERYRYLRNRVPAEVFDARGFKAGVWIDCEDDAGQLTLLTGDDADRDIDAAIDAAREST